MKTALLIVTLHAVGFGMIWQPFPFCTETHQVDSIRNVVWIDEAMDPGLAPYRGSFKLSYHPGTCITARSEMNLHFLDTTIVMEGDLSQDRRRQDFRWRGPGPAEYQNHGSIWFTPSGEQDSSLMHTYARVEDPPPIRISLLEVRRRSPQSLIITSSIKIGEEPWKEYAKDSVVVAGGVTTVFTAEEEGTYVTRCAAEGSTYVCTPTPVGQVTTDLNKQVWHMTGDRPDSLHTYREDGRLESTDHWSWSPRSPGTIRRLPPRPHHRAIAGLRYFDILGRLRP